MFDKKISGSLVLILWMGLTLLPGLGVSARGNDRPADAGSLATPMAAIPAAEDWDNGTLAFSRGAAGKWDYYLWGGFAQSLLKKGNTYYLYYQGSPSYDNQCGSVSKRSIGVATSTDGIHWKKYENNPVITWYSKGSIEEGAASSAAWVGADNRIYLYYGANTGTGCNVAANARLAVSEDGMNFQDAGEVLSGKDPGIWGSGDEIFPVGAYAYGNTWNMYYIPNGVSVSRKLGVARGSRSDLFTQSSGVNSPPVDAWGPVSVVVNGTASLLFTNPQGGKGPLNIYQFNAGDPSTVKLYDSYELSNCSQSVVLHDQDAGRWLMACRDNEDNNYIVRQAPFRTFADVPFSHMFHDYIEAFYQAGLTTGCSPAGQTPKLYCPNANVTRAEMAVFLERAMGNFNPAPNPTGMFTDVPSSFWASKFIDEYYNDGITTGCATDPLQYCPDNNVTRGEMAVFIERALGNFAPNPGQTGMFADVPDPNQPPSFQPFIEQFYLDGITTGCAVGPLRFCPMNLVTRQEMAVFIVRAFRLPMP